MNSDIDYEPTVSITFQPHEIDVIKTTLVKFPSKFSETNIDWTNHLEGTRNSEIYTREDLIALNAALAEWSRPTYDEGDINKITASELFEQTEQLIMEIDGDKAALEA